MTWKNIGKWAVTLTAPIWFFPVAVVVLVFLIFKRIHDGMWNHKPRSRKC